MFHCQHHSTRGRDVLCRGLTETCLAWEQSEGLFRASAAQEMLPQASQRSWGCAFCTCRRSSAETNGDRSVSSRPGMGTAAAPGELIPPHHQCWGESGASGWQESARLLPACICLAVPEAPSDIQLPHFGLQHKQQLIRHRRLREPDVPRCQAQGGCNTLNKAVPVRFPVRATGFELRIAGRG